jgi:uncharacterized delta-60 repeat protein
MKIKITNKISTPVFAILALILFGATNINAAPGDLDLSFGNGGIVRTPINNETYYYLHTSSMLVQPDGNIVVCGWFEDDNSWSSSFLARYKPSGTLDTSFGQNGKIVNPLLSEYVGRDMALQPDGKIVTVGSSQINRYHPNGTLDASFGNGGKVFLSNMWGSAVALQPDGKVIVGGSTRSYPYDFVVVRYSSDGSFDNSFGTGGVVITPIAESDYLHDIVLQPDGKIVAVGGARTGNPQNLTYFALVRFNADGSLDSGFGTNGKVFHLINNESCISSKVVLQPDGKIIAAGYFGDGYYTHLRSPIVRYNTNGSIDTSFAVNGIFTTDNTLGVGRDLALQSDGKILAFGNGLALENSVGFAVARLNPNGSPDFSFGTDGRVITSIPMFNDGVAAGAIQSDGKILAVGSGNDYHNSPNVIVRYLGNPVAPHPAQFDFDGDRRADLSVFRPSDRTWYLNQSTNGFSATQWGLATDKLTPADFDGDGRTDISVYRDGTWYWLKSSNNSFTAAQFGIASDIPVPADYTGDGRSELAIYRNGTWWTLNLTNNQTQVVSFGLSTDKPVPADYDGDGRTDQAVYRGSGEWHLNRSAQGYTVVNFGLATDKPVIADYDGDGRADQAVYRDGTWYLLQSSQGFTAFPFGISTDIPAPADYDGDGRTDAAIFRDGVWYLRQTTNGISIQQFGLTNDKPIPAAYLP